MANGWRIVSARVFAVAAAYSLAVASPLADENNRQERIDNARRPAAVREYPRDDERVRSPQPRVVTLIRDGITRSPTFAALLTALDASDVVVYVELARKMPTGLDGYLAHSVLVAGERRYLRIFVDFELEHDRLIETIAHELQHATEVAQARDVKSDEAIRRLFHRLDSGRCPQGCTETDAAIEIQKAVARELRAQRKVQLPRKSEAAREKYPIRRVRAAA